MSKAVISFPILGENASFNPPSSIRIGGFEMYFYGLIIAAGLALAVLYAMRVRKRHGITQDNILDLLIFGVPAGIVGARLYYAVFNAESYFGPGKWLNIFKLREGGLAIYGGVIFAAATVFIYSRVKKMRLGAMLDILGPGLLIGQAVGRWGNFINREAYGAATTLPWRMGLTLPGYGTTMYVHPTFLYESLWNTLGFFLLNAYSKRKKYDGDVFLLYLIWYGFGRFIIEGLRADSLYIPGTDIRASQLLSAIVLIASLSARMYIRLRGRTLAELTAAQSIEDSADNTDDAEDDEYMEDTDGGEPIEEKEDMENGEFRGIQGEGEGDNERDSGGLDRAVQDISGEGEGAGEDNETVGGDCPGAGGDSETVH